MSPSSHCCLTDLPGDIQKLIVAAIDAPSPLFNPRYYVHKYNEWVYGGLAEKQKIHYGDQNEEQQAASIALLNWSSTCTLYRGLLGPLIFENVVLRAQAKSLNSCSVLASTDHWQHVTSLVVCGTYLIEERHRDTRDFTRIDPLDDFDFDQLSNILSHLPPDLRKLTLDFPTEWSDECHPRDGSSGGYLNVLDTDERLEQTIEHESTKNWRKLIFTVFNAVAKNDISSKQDFELRLLNIPPLPCSAYWSDDLHHFLSHVKDMTLSFSHFDNGAGWNMNTMKMPVHFASNLHTWFWNHLTAIETLSIHADQSWPFGLAPGRCHIPLALPDSELQFQRLASVSLKWWFVDSELVTFLKVNTPALVHLTLINYYGHCNDRPTSLAEYKPTWADFFAALRKHPTLTHFSLVPHLSGYRLLDPFNMTKGELTDDEDPFFRMAFEEVQTLEAVRRSEKETGTWTARSDARMKRVWPHATLDSKYGMVFDVDDYNAERFHQGSDHEAWLKLCDALERKGGACNVVDAVS